MIEAVHAADEERQPSFVIAVTEEQPHSVPKTCGHRLSTSLRRSRSSPVILQRTPAKNKEFYLPGVSTPFFQRGILTRFHFRFLPSPGSSVDITASTAAAPPAAGVAASSTVSLAASVTFLIANLSSDLGRNCTVILISSPAYFCWCLVQLLA